MQLDLDRTATPAAKAVDARANEETMEPGVEPIRVAQPREISPGADQRLLDRVSRELAIPEDESGGCIKPRDGRTGKHREGVMIALLRLLDETTLVHCRPLSGAATRSRSDGMSGGQPEWFPAGSRARHSRRAP